MRQHIRLHKPAKETPQNSTSASKASMPAAMHPVLNLQRTIGNHAVTRMFQPTLQREPPDLDTLYADKPALDGDFLADYKNIRALMLNKSKMISHLQLLEAKLKTGMTLSHALQYYETQVGFPSSRPTLVGFVSADFFLDMIRKGQQFKDYGAPTQHGEYTHRLQWFIIASEITEQFSKPMGEGWKHSPLELFSKSGDSQLNTKSGFMWDLIVDRTGVGEGEAGLNKFLNEEGYTSPEALIGDLIRDDPWLFAEVAPTKDSLEQLIGAIKARKSMRDNERESGGITSKDRPKIHNQIYIKSLEEKFPELKIIGRDSEKLPQIIYKKEGDNADASERIKASREKLFDAIEGEEKIEQRTPEERQLKRKAIAKALIVEVTSEEIKTKAASVLELLTLVEKEKESKTQEEAATSSDDEGFDFTKESVEKAVKELTLKFEDLDLKEIEIEKYYDQVDEYLEEIDDKIWNR